MATTVKEILQHKGGEVVSASPETDVGTAAAEMNQRGIGALLVTDDDGDLRGIVTERDILTKVVGTCVDPCSVPVREIMSRPVVYCTPETPLQACKMVFTDKHIRHLPVVEDGRLVGIITSGDVLADEVRDHRETIDLLTQYIQSW